LKKKQNPLAKKYPSFKKDITKLIKALKSNPGGRDATRKQSVQSPGSNWK